MPPTITNRELKNKATGIDIIVPEYQVIPGKIVNTVLYHIIVITRLFYFKTRQHKESDLVQFAVAKKYEDVEELHSKLVAKFPSVNFQPLPKLSLIITEKTLNERKKFLEELLGLVAKTPKLCSSSPVLSFLDVNKITIKQNKLQKPEMTEKPTETAEVSLEDKEIDRDIFGVTELEESDEDDMSSSDDTKIEDAKQPNDPLSKTEKFHMSIESSAVDDEKADIFIKSSGKFSFGNHEEKETDISDLFIPEEAKKFDKVDLFLSDDEPDLFKIEDDLNLLLNVSTKHKSKSDFKSHPAPKPDLKSHPAPKPNLKPRLTPKPDLKPRPTFKPDLKPRPTPKPRFVGSDADVDFLAQSDKSAKAVKSNKSTDDVDKFSKATDERNKSELEGTRPKPKPRTRCKNVDIQVKTDQNTTDGSKSKISESKSETLDDIFGKPSTKDFLSGLDDDDDDLFKSLDDSEDITKYIKKNIALNDDVNLFS